MTLPTNNPLKLVYRDLYRLNIEGHTNWCTHVDELIRSVGLGEIWDEQKSPPSVNDIRLLNTQSKCKLQHNYIRDWFGEIGNVDRHPILRTYAIFKTKFTQENYMELLSNKKYQRAISRFRVSSHRLGIETGRHEKPRVPPELRLCKYCESEAVDDELHFLINCDFHLRDRQILFSLVGKNTDNFYSLTDIDKFKEILTSQGHDVILALGKFIHDGFKSRDRVYN